MIKKLNKKAFYLIFTTLAYLLVAHTPDTAFAHVKWFSQFNFANRPLTLFEAMTPVYFGLITLSVVVIGGMVFVDKSFNQLTLIKQINRSLTAQKDNSLMIMRLAMAAVLLISWASNAVLAPELISTNAFLIWLQFVIVILLIFRYTTPTAGFLLITLYLLTSFEFGFFHLLDYPHYAGIGFYLFVSNNPQQRWRELGLPALYATIGFSLMWLGYEKLIYPSWSLYLLAENPQLALGLQPDFFLQGAAFVEIALGYLLIIGLLERPLAAVITLVFFTTTLIFGKIEIIGHTPIHAALIIFLFNGAGKIYKPPIAIHRQISWRVAFAVVNFVILTLSVGWLYSGIAQWQFSHVQAEQLTQPNNTIDLSQIDAIPTFTSLEAIPELDSRYNLHVTLEHWQFTPELVGGPSFPNQGHGHVTVNGQDGGHLYGEWLALGHLAPGSYEIIVTLHGNDHAQFVADGQPIQAVLQLIVPTKS